MNFPIYAKMSGLLSRHSPSLSASGEDSVRDEEEKDGDGGGGGG